MPHEKYGIPPTMKAVVMHERGGPDVLRYEEVPTPLPGPGEVLIRVRAASVNRTDLFHRSGRFSIQKALPHILGMDGVGTIALFGDGVKGWCEDDRVAFTFEALGRERNGAYAEYAVVPETEMRRVPFDLGDVAASTVGLAFTTAWIAMMYNGKLSPNGGERVVVHAAGSGVGTAAVQIAHWLGATVVAIAGDDKADALRDLGAMRVLDRRSEDLPKQVRLALRGRGATLVLELVGHATLQPSIDMIDYRGRIVVAGTLSGDQAQINAMDLLMKNATLTGSFDVIQPADYEHILRLMARGVFKPVVEKVLPLAQAAEAHRLLEAGGTFGKVVLIPVDGFDGDNV